MALTGGATVPGVPPAEALLPLAMPAAVPPPAQHLDARRTLQLQLLTRRNDPAPAQTWAEDVARVLASPFDAEFAKRLKGVLRVLLKYPARRTAGTGKLAGHARNLRHGPASNQPSGPGA